MGEAETAVLAVPKAVGERPVSVVTGATSGVGMEIARGLVQAGHHVISVGRNEEKGRALCEEVSAAGGAGACDFLSCDLSSVRAVAALVRKIRQHYARCDVLVNCAGTPGPKQREVTEEGLEVVFATNVVAYHLLCLLLLDLLEASERGGRIVIVASDFAGGLDLNDLEREAPGAYAADSAYQASKQANRMLAGALNTAIQQHGGRVVVNSMTPRLCRTPLAESMTELAKTEGRSAQEGAVAALFLATSHEAAAREGGWHWRDHQRRHCEFRDVEAEAWLATAVEAAAQSRLGVEEAGLGSLPWHAHAKRQQQEPGGEVSNSERESE